MSEYPDIIPSLTTTRLDLNPLTEVHRDGLFALFSDEEVTQLMGMSLMSDRSEVDSWIDDYRKEQKRESRIERAIVVRNTQQFIGRCALTNINWAHRRSEVSCAFQKQFWGNKFANESLREVLRYAFSELNLHRIEAQLWPDNGRMLSVLRSLGFVKEGLLKGHFQYKGTFGDTTVCALLNPEHHATQATISTLSQNR